MTLPHFSFELLVPSLNLLTKEPHLSLIVHNPLSQLFDLPPISFVLPSNNLGPTQFILVLLNPPLILFNLGQFLF